MHIDNADAVQFELVTVWLDKLQLNKYKMCDTVAVTDIVLCEFKYDRMVMSVDWGKFWVGVFVCQFKILPYLSAGSHGYSHKSLKNSWSPVGICTRYLLNVNCVEHFLITDDSFEVATVLCTEF